MVNVYWTRTTTMDGAELVACINREVVTSDRDLGDAFLKLMQLVAVQMAHLRLKSGVSGIEVRVAPEHEKAGHA